MILRPIIGVHGKARHGKDETVEAILRTGGAKHRHAFAEPIKAMIRAAFGIDVDDPFWRRRINDPLTELAGHSLRELMQSLGDWGKAAIHPDIWVRMAADHYETTGPGLVMSDVRFENEAAWVRAQGGLVIHVTRPGVPPTRQHNSESGIERRAGDPLIVNDGTLEELYEAVHDIIHGSEW